MLNMIRKHADSWLIKTVLWLIVFAFVGTIFYSWGMGGSSGGRGGVIATVNGVNINLSEYDRFYNNLVNFYRNQFGGQFSEETIEKLDLKNVALDDLIKAKLLILEAENQDIRVSDDEIRERLTGQASFKKDKVFSKALYDQFLSNNRLTANEFEESLRKEMLLTKVEEWIKGNTRISDDEMRAAYNRENEKIKFKYIQFSKTHFKSEGTPSDEAIKKYFEAHKTSFEVPQQIQVQYLKLTPDMFASQIQVVDEDIQDYYTAHQPDFLVETRYKARHILFKFAPDSLGDEASDEERKKALDEAEKKSKAKAEEISNKIKDGAQFEKMAEEHSDDRGTAVRGGDLGQFPKGTMVAEFETALAGMKVGEVSKPIKTVFGYHLIRLDELKPERLKPVSEVREEITKKLKEKKGRQRIRRTIKKVSKSAAKDNDLVRAAREFKQEPKTTEFISGQSHQVADIGSVPEFFNVAFTVNDNVVSTPVNTNEASFLLKVVARKEAYIPELSDVLSKVTAKVSEETVESLTKEKFKTLSKKLEETGDLEKLAKELKLEVQDTLFFSMVDSIPGVGNIKSIKEAVFRKKAGEVTSGSSRHSHYLIQVLERDAAPEPSDADLKEQHTILKTEKANQVFKEWVENTRDSAEILVDRTLL